MTTTQEMLDRVKSAVQRFRTRYNIIPSSRSGLEGSCFASGEGRNLFSQLVYTLDDRGDWLSLRFSDVLETVYNFVLKEDL